VNKQPVWLLFDLNGTLLDPGDTARCLSETWANALTGPFA
jgi:hypothetical protein